MTARVLLLTTLALAELSRTDGAGECHQIKPSNWHLLNPNSTEGQSGSGLLLAEYGDNLYTLMKSKENPYEKICDSKNYKVREALQYFPDEKLQEFPCMFYEEDGFYSCDGGSCLPDYITYLDCGDYVDWHVSYAGLYRENHSGGFVEGREGLLVVAFYDVDTGEETEGGTVCDDSFNGHAADLACQYLGFEYAEDWGSKPKNFEYIPERVLEEKNVKILVDEVNCDNSTSHITECEAQIMSGHDCSLGESVWLKCGSRNSTDPQWELLYAGLIRVDDWSRGDERRGREGLLALGIVNKYDRSDYKVGTVCDDYFNDHAADLSCQYLGYRFAEAWGSDPKNFQYFPRDLIEQYEVQILIDDVKCDEKDRNITDCEMNILEKNDCNLEQSLWIKCKSVWELASVQLYNVDNRTGEWVNGTEGFLVVRFSDPTSNFVIGTVERLSSKTANLACKFMGYGSAEGFGYKPQVPSPYPVLVEDIYCSKADTDIKECDATLLEKENRREGEGVWLLCRSDDDDDDDDEQSSLEVDFGGAGLTMNLDKIRRKWIF